MRADHRRLVEFLAALPGPAPAVAGALHARPGSARGAAGADGERAGDRHGAASSTTPTPTFGLGLRHALFNVVSVATTSGLVSQDYSKWPVFAPYWMVFLSCIVSSTGSAGGGIKMFRTLLLARQAGRELKLLVHPSAVAPVRIGGRPVPDRVCNSVLAFIFLYFMTAAVLIFALLLSGLDFQTAMGAILASLNNTGAGLGGVGPGHTYQALSGFQAWICTARHAAGPAGDLQRAGAVHADVLAQVAKSSRPYDGPAREILVGSDQFEVVTEDVMLRAQLNCAIAVCVFDTVDEAGALLHLRCVARQGSNPDATDTTLATELLLLDRCVRGAACRGAAGPGAEGADRGASAGAQHRAPGLRQHAHAGRSLHAGHRRGTRARGSGHRRAA